MTEMRGVLCGIVLLSVKSNLTPGSVRIALHMGKATKYKDIRRAERRLVNRQQKG